MRKDAVRLADGKVLDDFYIVERKFFSIVFAITPQKEVVLVRQYRHGAEDILTELPAGYIEDGETPETAARRELIEETGYTPGGGLEFIGEFIIGPAGTKHRAYAYLARNAVRAGSQSLDSNEDIEILTMPLEALSGAVLRGEIKCMTAVAVIMTALEIIRRDGE